MKGPGLVFEIVVAGNFFRYLVKVLIITNVAKK
jgi:hypothetical protein